MLTLRLLGGAISLLLALVAAAEPQQRTVLVDDLERELIVYAPPSLKPNAPLVLVFHGYSGTAERAMKYTGMNAIADQHGFVVAYPQGTLDSEDNTFFNVGYDFHASSSVNDLRFVRAVIAELLRDYDLNPEAVFATGMSNGGDLSYLLACEASDVVAGVAPVAGTMMQDNLGNCASGRPIPILAIAGTDDNVTLFEGDMANEGGWGAYLPQEDIVAFWVDRNDLDDAPVTELLENTADDGCTVELTRYAARDGSAEFRYYRVQNGGHDWPGARYDWWNPMVYVGRFAMGFYKAEDIDSSAVIGAFFAEIARSR